MRNRLTLVFSMLALAFSIAVAAAVVLQEQPTPEAAGSLPADPATAAPAPEPAPRGTASAATRLPTQPIPATTEHLQQESEHVAQQLRTRYPDLPAALNVVALLKSQLRQSEAAEQLWKRCLQLEPDSVQYYINLAAIAIERGNSELAAETGRQALAAGCDSEDILHHLALALTNLGECAQAEEVLQQALDRYPQSAACWLVLGQAQLKLGQAADAEASLREAMERGAGTPSLFFALGNACARQGKDEQAQAFRRQFTDLKKSAELPAQQRFQILSSKEARRVAVTTIFEAGTVHFQQQDLLEAERLYLRGLALEPANPAICGALADLYRQAGMPAEERVVRERLCELQPLELVHYVDLAEVAAALGDEAASEAVLKMAITIAPEAAEAYTMLAQFHLQSGRKPQHARWYAQEAVRRQPTAQGFLLLAETCRMLGDEAGARSAMTEATRLQQEEPPTD